MEWEVVGVGRWRSVWDEGEKTCCRIGGGHLVAGVLHVRVWGYVRVRVCMSALPTPSLFMQRFLNSKSPPIFT